MSYRDAAVLAPLPVEVKLLREYEKEESVETKEMLKWLSKKLLSEIDNAGFARTQEEYEKAYDSVFEALDILDENLGSRKYLTGKQISGADICLYSVLVRFDGIFYFAYRLNKKKIVDYKNLFHYAKKLYHMEAFRRVTDLVQIKNAYYEAQSELQNPYHIVMLGPEYQAWE